jgi:hypothetical protein
MIISLPADETFQQMRRVYVNSGLSPFEIHAF